MKLSIIIPVYNERATAAALIDQVLAVPLPGVEKEVVIVESGSTDGSREIVRGYGGRPGVRVVHEAAARGKGAAVRAGLGLVGGDVVLVQDADLEYSVGDYARLLAPLRSGQADVVFGSRALASRGWRFRRFSGAERAYGFAVNLGAALYTRLFNALYGQRLTDGATMFKLFRREALQGIQLRSATFAYDWELSAKLARKGCRFMELPVAYKARSRAEGKKARLWRDGPRVLWAICKYRVCS